jgi:hypothetical protein
MLRPRCGILVPTAWAPQVLLSRSMVNQDNRVNAIIPASRLARGARSPQAGSPRRHEDTKISGNACEAGAWQRPRSRFARSAVGRVPQSSSCTGPRDFVSSCLRGESSGGVSAPPSLAPVPVDRTRAIPARLPPDPGGESALPRLTRSTTPTIPPSPRAGTVRPGRVECGR